MTAFATVSDGRTLSGARTKTRLLAYGLRLTVTAQQAVAERGKPMLRVRSGSCGGLDVMLEDGTYINAPVREAFVDQSPMVLDAKGDELWLHDAVEGTAQSVALVPAPAYYDAVDAEGQPMSRTGQLCSDRLGVGLTNICTYWRSATRRCQFCSIGLNVREERADKSLERIMEVVEAALGDPIAPARHVLLGGGTPDGDDAGAFEMARVAAAIKKRFTVSVYAMVTPPRDLACLRVMHEAGIDEIGLNIEVFSSDAAARYLPGKHAAIGHDRYWRALRQAVEIFGPINTRSITVVGLESPDETVAGVGRLAAAGVLPILSPLRPLVGTPLERHKGFSEERLWDITVRCASAAAEHGMPLGPTCIPCQSNTLTLPGHPFYHHY